MIQLIKNRLPNKGRFYIATAPGRILNGVILVWAYKVFGDDFFLLAWFIGLTVDATVEFFLQKLITFELSFTEVEFDWTDYFQSIGGRLFAAGVTFIPVWVVSGQEVDFLFLVLYFGTGIFSWTFNVANQYRINLGSFKGFWRFYIGEITVFLKAATAVLVWFGFG